MDFSSADESRTTVVIDATSYEEKALSLLQDDNVYAKLKKKNPTQKFESNHISLLKELKESVAINAKTYRKIYSTISDVPTFFGLVKVHKTGAQPF